MKRLSILLCFLYIGPFTAFEGMAQVEGRSAYRMMFYNVENLFDTENDSAAKDEEFTPDGKNHWTPERYEEKRNKIAKTIIACGQWDPPQIVGLSEIENEGVLNDLLKQTPLSTFDYAFLHKESPDWRGIDVALLYRKQAFTPLETQFLEVRFSNEDFNQTRDILYAKGVVQAENAVTDTVNIFINHWPSRYGGQAASEPKRVKAASVLRSKVDSLKSTNRAPQIVIMGDFNDEPSNKSIEKVLKAKPDTTNENGLINLMHPEGQSNVKGTYKYQYKWNILDQFIVSKAIFEEGEGLSTSFEDVSVLREEFLLKPDNQYPGKQPYRTYLGPLYKGGYSDHLPILMDLHFDESE